MGKKIKKFLKKAAKAAIIGGALYGATKLARRRATDKPGNAFAKARKAMTSDAAYGKAPYVDAIRRQKTLTPPEDFGIMGYRKGGLIKGKPKLAKKGWK